MRSVWRLQRCDGQKPVKLGIGALALFAGLGSARGDVIEFFDKVPWIAAVGEFTTIDFTGFPDGTPITDQYADPGVLFTDGTDFVLCCGEGTFPNDGAGLGGLHHRRRRDSCSAPAIVLVSTGIEQGILKELECRLPS